MNIRIIPRLDIKGSNLVKGIQMEGLRILGKPEDFATQYYEQGADELFYIDIVASLYGRNSLLEIISKTSKKIFIPLTVSGGLRTIEDVRNALNAGADKVALNTAVIKNPNLISDLSNQFGSSTIVVSIEAKKNDNSYEAYTDNGREKTGKDAIRWASEAVGLGAGEVIVTSVDHEGTGKGFDLDLVSDITNSVTVPVVACGGAGNKNHVFEVAKYSNASGIGIGSMFHYDLVSKRKIEARDENSYQSHLKMERGYSNVQATSLKKTKEYLFANGLTSREI
tara:strand:+ start:1540 stop:2382 length:843 start_codon:yes stop_codon:yes gene_type:complete